MIHCIDGWESCCLSFINIIVPLSFESGNVREKDAHGFYNMEFCVDVGSCRAPLEYDDWCNKEMDKKNTIFVPDFFITRISLWFVCVHITKFIAANVSSVRV